MPWRSSWSRHHGFGACSKPALSCAAREALKTFSISAWEIPKSSLPPRFSTLCGAWWRKTGRLVTHGGEPIADDIAFIRLLLNEGILAVPGTGFGRSGYMRLSLTISREQMERSFAGFERAIKAAS